MTVRAGDVYRSETGLHCRVTRVQLKRGRIQIGCAIFNEPAVAFAYECTPSGGKKRKPTTTGNTFRVLLRRRRGAEWQMPPGYRFKFNVNDNPNRKSNTMPAKKSNGKVATRDAKVKLRKRENAQSLTVDGTKYDFAELPKLPVGKLRKIYKAITGKTTTAGSTDAGRVRLAQRIRKLVRTGGKSYR